MKNIIQSLTHRQKYLEKTKQMIEAELLNAPEGFLRITHNHKSIQYYLRTDPKDYNGIYIPKSNRKLALDLAQKDYHKKLLRSINQELKAIHTYLSSLPQIPPENIFDSLHTERKSIVLPIMETDEQFRKRWEEFSFIPKEIDDSVPLIYSEKGERVRSKSEVIIADILHREGIPYRYESPITLKGLGKIYPDFTTLNIQKRKTLYWEHFGMMDDPAYIQKALIRIQDYEDNGYYIGENLIITWETKHTPLNPRIVRDKIARYLK